MCQITLKRRKAAKRSRALLVVRPADLVLF